jgi:hypothetical protein
MTTDQTFETLYQQLASAWDAHQRLRTAHSAVNSLAQSWTSLHQARLAMSDWHANQRLSVG